MLRRNGFTLKVMTLNIWNYNDPWSERLPLIIKAVREENPDIVGFQEIRSDLQFDNEGKNQAEQIAERLPGYNFVFERAQIDGKTRWEGLATMAMHSILSFDHLKLSRNPNEPRDWRHQRIVLRAEIELPVGPLHFFNTHLSLSEKCRDHSIVEVVDFIRRFKSNLPKIIVGDFNAPPDQKSIRFMLGETYINGKKTAFHDCWREIHGGEEGLTYRVIDKLASRIDYVFINSEGEGAAWKILDSRLTANRPDKRGLFPSDHYGLAAKIRLGI